MRDAFVSIGSNINASTNMELVKDRLNVFKEISYSSVYKSPAEGFVGEDFLNCVCKFQSAENPHELRQILKSIEKDMGRDISQKGMSNRVIDLDLILLGDLVIHDGEVDIPSTDIEKYKFVLEPLAEIAPDMIHPTLKKSFKNLLLYIFE
tara:strand:- start:2371 stop:2820 length:450 start_codon:yes stop_codon:yes gene_type:complete